MTDYGVTEAGYVTKPQTEIQKSLIAKASIAPALGPDLDYSSASPTGQLFGIFSATLAELYELGGQVYASNDPEAAIGVPLDNVMSVTGTTREGARASTVTLTLNLDDGTSVPAGSLVFPAGRETVLFQTNADVENTSGVTANVTVTATCTVTGPVNVAAGQMTGIGSPVTGWNSVTNAADAVPGRNVMNDQEARVLRSQQLFKRGGCTIGALVADVLDVEGIEDAIGLTNRGDSIDADGLPPKSFEIILDDGAIPAADDDEIAQVIFDSGGGGAGVTSVGAQSGTAVDEFGVEQTVNFSRTQRLNVYIDLTLTTSSAFPANGNELVKAAIVAAGNAYRSGDTAVALYLRSQAFTVAGVVDVPTFTLGYTASPTNDDNLDVTKRQRNSFDTSRVTIL